MCVSCSEHSDPLDWEDRPDSVPLWRHAFAGSLAGITEHVGMYPLDTVKTRMQTASLPAGYGVMQTIRTIITERGFLGLFRGATVIGTGCVPAHCGLFMTYELGKSHVPSHGDVSQSLLTATAVRGAAASTVHDLILTPYDVVKQRLQLGYYKGPWHCVRTILRREGVGALYRSLPVTLLSNAPNLAVLAMVNESMKTAFGLDRGFSGDLPWFFLCGGVAGVVAAAATCPLDVVKTQVQTRGMGTLECTQSIWRNHGIQGFYNGLAPRMIAAAPSAAMCWGTYETVQSLLCIVCDEVPPDNATGRAAKQAVIAARKAAAAADAAALAAGLGTDSGGDPLEWEHWDPTKAPLWKHIFAASAAGVMEHVAMYPVDTVKTHMQAVSADPGAAPLTVRGAVSDVLRQGGTYGFFRGCTAIGGACIPAHVGLFGTYELSKAWLLKGGAEKEHAPLRAAVCGALSTMVHDSIIVPMDVVKQRLQLGCYNSMLDCLTTTYRAEGIAAFYRSLPATILMECPFYAILVAVNESLKLSFRMEGASRSADRSGLGWHFASAGLSGIVASAVTQPLDVIKTRLQTQELLRDMSRDGGATLEVRYRGLASTFSSILRHEGVRGMYRGTLPRMVFAAPSAAMCWGTYEAVKTVLLRFD